MFPNLHIIDRALLLVSLDLLVVGLFIAFLNSELAATLWRNTNIMIKLMFAIGIAVSYLYLLFPHMESFVNWIGQTYWGINAMDHEEDKILVHPLSNGHWQP